VVAAAPLAHTRADGETQVQVAGLETADGQITIGLSVADGEGTPIANLSAADFALAIDGKPLAVRSVEAGADAALPIAIAIAVDTSGSMSGAALQAARAGLGTLVSSLGAQDAAALIAFAARVETVVPFTTDKALLASGIESLEAAGNTALYDAIAAAASSASASGYPRHAVVFLADGEDFGGVSTLDRAAALRAASDSGVPFYVVAVGDEIDGAFLQQLASDTAGQYFAAATAADIERLYGQISESLRLQYTVSANLPAELAGGKHSLSITVAGGTTTSAFATDAEVPATLQRTTISLLGFEPTLAKPTLVTVSGEVDASHISWLIDGEVVATGTAGFTLDPYVISPGDGRQLTVRYAPPSGEPVEHSETFFVPKLPPRIVSPLSLPELRAGDIVRLDVASQTGGIIVQYRINDAVVEVDEAAPYEFVVPRHAETIAEFTIVISDRNGTSLLESTITPFAAGGNDSTAARILSGALVIAGLGALFAASAAWIRSARDTRPLKPDFEGLGPAFERWVRATPERKEDDAVIDAGPHRSGPWATLTVVDGKGKGRTFALNDDTELVGRAEYCSVRIEDKSLEPAHLLIHRDGTYRTSTPRSEVEVDGNAGLWGSLANGSLLRLGNVSLEFRHGA
jgi:VWFA-related protein